MVLKQKTLFWQIFPAVLVIILLSIIAVSWYSSRSIDTFYIQESANDLVNRAYLIKARVTELLKEQKVNELRNFAIESGRASETRITVIAQDGTVLADTKENPESMDNHRSRPEIDEAFNGSNGISLRFSNTLGERLLYAAIPISVEDVQQSDPIDGPVFWVLRLSLPVTAIDAALTTVNHKLFFGTVAAVFFALVVSLIVTRNISRPLEEMTKRAEYYSKGDFSQRMMIKKASASREIASLAGAMDQMADQLDEKINTIINQRNQLETVFSSMVEAVIAVNQDEKIISINEAAARMFGIERIKAQGRLVQEVIRNASIQEQIRHILETEQGIEDEVVLVDERGENYLQTHGVSLYDGTARSIGALIVLNDVTRLRRLERVRRDFVANVSHELRTPITSIRGYVETLLDGALEDREDALRFLEIVLRQSEQLSEIIDDLLSLSRIEQDSNEKGVNFDVMELAPVLEEATQTCRQRAADKEIDLLVDCPSEITMKMNRTLLLQAIVNLVINGITYSEKKGAVTVQAREEGEDNHKNICISVRDRGIGISREHLPRLFERFYRSDKARSRTAGGTGLGLSIVKHIVHAHGGNVDVRSKLGEGSEFIITIPV